MIVTLTACSNTNKLGPSANTDAAVTDNSTAAGDQQDAQPQVCPGTTVTSCPTSIPSYWSVIAPIVQSRCNGCHSQTNDAGLWPLNDQQSLSDWQFIILQAMRACTQPPPGSGVSLTMSERKSLEAWLVCGAPNN
jgi:uncharacterized membrane protein